jgi:ribose-phosphate pyrophosphokinase
MAPAHPAVRSRADQPHSLQPRRAVIRTPASRQPALQIHAFADTARFARQLAEALRVAVVPVDLHHFPDGESLVRVRVPVARHAVLVRSLHDPNVKLVEIVLAADALRRAGARRVTLVAPYLPYMRQDAVFAPGEPISQRVIGAWLGHTFDDVLTVEAHLHRIERLDAVIAGNARALTAAPVLAQWVRRTGRGCVVVGPDAESEPWVRAIARAAHVPWVVGHKQRLHDRVVRIDFPKMPVTARAVIVDDIASSGATLAVAARALRKAGIAVVDAAVVHAIFAPGAVARIRAAGVRHLVSCDTVPHSTNALTCVPLVVAALRSTRRHGGLGPSDRPFC